MEDSNDENDEDFEEDGEEDHGAAYNKFKSKLLKAKAGKGGDSDESDPEDANDADYEENAGEYALYDSPLEQTDELINIKETLDAIYQADQNAYQYVTSTIPFLNAFIELLGKADELK